MGDDYSVDLCDEFVRGISRARDVKELSAAMANLEFMRPVPVIVYQGANPAFLGVLAPFEEGTADYLAFHRLMFSLGGRFQKQRCFCGCAHLQSLSQKPVEHLEEKLREQSWFPIRSPLAEVGGRPAYSIEELASLAGVQEGAIEALLVNDFGLKEHAIRIDGGIYLLPDVVDYLADSIKR